MSAPATRAPQAGMESPNSASSRSMTPATIRVASEVSTSLIFWMPMARTWSQAPEATWRYAASKAVAPDDEAVSRSTDEAPEMPSRPEILAAVLSTPEKAKGFWLPTTTDSMSCRRTGLPEKISPARSASSKNDRCSLSLPL